MVRLAQRGGRSLAVAARRAVNMAAPAVTDRSVTAASCVRGLAGILFSRRPEGTDGACPKASAGTACEAVKGRPFPGFVQAGYCRVAQERNQGDHLRLEVNAFLLLGNGDLHADRNGRLDAIGDRHHARHDAVIDAVGKGLGADLASLSGLDLADVALRDGQLDFQFREVGQFAKAEAAR